MSRQDTGETTASIVRGTNERAWAEVLPMLRAGRQLRRERTGRFYVDGHGGLTVSFVRRKELAGELRRVGVDTYAIPEATP